MKKILIGLVALVASSAVLATGGGNHQSLNAHSGSVSGTGAGTSAVGGGLSVNGSGPGFAYQGSIAGATNTTVAGARAVGDGSSVDLRAGVSSEGTTYSYSDGVQGGLGLGATSGAAIQGGVGSAEASGHAADFNVSFRPFTMSAGLGGAEVDSFAAQGSVAATSNVNNGSAGAVSDGNARSDNVASLAIDARRNHVTVDHSVDSEASAGGGGDTLVSGNGSAFAAGGGIADGDASTFAVTFTSNGFHPGAFNGNDD